MKGHKRLSRLFSGNLPAMFFIILPSHAKISDRRRIGMGYELRVYLSKLQVAEKGNYLMNSKFNHKFLFLKITPGDNNPTEKRTWFKSLKIALIF